MLCRRVIALITLSLTGLPGCWDSRRISVPAMDPQAAGAEAVATYDADGDGALMRPRAR